jgi:hypothetical protein
MARPVIAGLAVVVAGIVLAVVAFGSGGGGSDGDEPVRQSGGLVADEATPTVQATIDLNQPTAVATRPPNAPVPGAAAGDRFMVPKFGISAPITLKAVPPTGGVLPEPAGPDDVVYYDWTAYDQSLGGTPGFGGNSIFSGHVDWGAGGCARNPTPRGVPCQAVFWDVSDLVVGDMVEIQVQGTVYRYRVTGNQAVKADDQATWDKVWAATAQESITMITCGGNFNRTTREYSHRQVVTAVRV